MLYLITDPDCDDYALLESANNDGIITHIYCNTTTDDIWTFSTTFSQWARSELPTRHPLSSYLCEYRTLFEATSMQELKWLIDRHPEVFI